MSYYSIFLGTETNLGNWETIPQSFSIRAFTGIIDEYDEYNEYGGITLTPPELKFLEIIRFSDKVVENWNTIVENEEIKLDPEQKLISILMDKSGSMLWNDPNGIRYELAKQFSQRIDLCSDTTQSFMLYAFGGKRANILFSANKSQDNPFANEENGCYQFQIVRKVGSYPTSPTDGTIVYTGIDPAFTDLDTTSGNDYYYSLFTYGDGNFSEKKDLKVHCEDTGLFGINNLRSTVRTGIGPISDANTLANWNFEEGEGTIIYDFSGNNNHLEITANVIANRTYNWTSSFEAPYGKSCLKLIDRTNKVYATTTALDLSLPFSVFLCVKLYDTGGTQIIFTNNLTSVPNIIRLYSKDTGELYLEYNTPSVDLNLEQSITFNEWHFIGLTIDELGNARSFVRKLGEDSTFVNCSSTYTNSFVYNPGLLEIGWNGASLNGEIKSLFFSNSVLPDSFFEYYSDINLFPTKDNGDRLNILSWRIPATENVTGKTVKIIQNNFNEVLNDQDGDEIYSEDAATGDTSISLLFGGENGTTANYKAFIESSNEISHYRKSNSLEVEMPITDIADAEKLINYLNISTSTIDLVVESYQNQNFLYWTVDKEASTVAYKIFFSNTETPSVGLDGQVSGTLIGTISPDEKIFFHSNIENSIKYYYAVIGINNLGQVVSMGTGSGIPKNSLTISTRLPKVSGISYEIVNDQVLLRWNSLTKDQVANFYFGDTVDLFAKITDDLGNELDQEYFTDLIATATSVQVDDASTTNSYDISNLFYDIDEYKGSQIHGTVKLAQNSSTLSTLLTNIREIIITLSLNIYAKDANGNKVFQYLSDPITIIFRNQLDVNISNKNAAFVYFSGKEAINNQIVNKEYVYDGNYIGASKRLEYRVTLTNKGSPARLTNEMGVSVYTASKDVYSDSDAVSIANSTDISPPTPAFTSGVIDFYDRFGNIVEKDIDGYYFDIPLDYDAKVEKYLLFCGVASNGSRIIKKKFFMFDSPLKAEIFAGFPPPNGTSVSECSANFYFVDPDNPHDETLRTLPADGTSVKWEIIKNSESFPSRVIYGTSGIGGSTATSTIIDGTSKDVFIAPISNIYFDEVDGEKINENHTLKLTVVNSSVNIVNEAKVYATSLIDYNKQYFNSNFLMEFDNSLQKLYSDGIGYAKLTINHDPFSADPYLSHITPNEAAFVEYMVANSKAQIPLYGGQIVFLEASDSSIEIIHGDVFEYYDPYTGLRLLDTTNATINTGSAFVELTKYYATEVYFRINKDSSAQRITGTTKTTNCTFGGKEQFNYSDEIVVRGTVNTAYNGANVILTGGGDKITGVPPTILVPQEPLEARVVEKSSGSTIYPLLPTGTNEDVKIKVQLTYDDNDIPTGTSVSWSSCNLFNNEISLRNTASAIYTETDEYSVSRSYVDLDLLPITNTLSFKADVYGTFTFLIEETPITKTFKISLFNEEPNLTYAGRFLNSVYKTDSSLAPITTGTDMPTRRGGMASVIDGDLIYAIGGINDEGMKNEVEAYSISGDSWTTLSSMNEKRAYATSCFYDSKIYVFGGLTQRDDGTSYVNNSVEVYDISADEWTYLDNMPSIKCSSSSKETEYGTFSSCGVLVGTNFYILCGIREISAKGEMPIYNDHVLIYDLVAETWTTIDMSGEEIYERSGAGAFPSQYENGIFVLFGEKVNSSGEEILSNIFMFNITAGTITDKTEMYLSAYPEAKARFGIKYDDGSGSPFPIFYSGGKNKNNQLSKTISEIEYAVTSNFANSAIPNIYLQDPVIDHSFIYNPNDGALFVIGGISTGKSSKFTTFSGEYSTKMILDGKLDINVKLSAKNIYNQLTSTTFNAEVEAYLQPIDDTSEVILPINSKNFVLLSSNEVSFVNGVCETTLEARADDVLPNISEILSIYESEQERYQIVLKISSLDTNFVGGNFIYTPTSYTECSKDSSVQIIEREIPNLVSSGYGYSVVTPYVYQPSLEKIHCYEKDIVLPYIEQLTPIAVASSGLSDALDILDGQLDIGPSYVFDAIYEMAKDLSGSSFDAYNKNILCISDKEVQEMKYNLNDVSLSVNSLEGYGKCPIEYVNLSIGQNGSVQKWKSTISLLNKLTLATVGDVTTISDGTYIEETVTSLYSKKEGTINFGKCSIIIDLTRIVNISQISLVSTGDIQWSFEYGDDGKNFTKVEEIFGGEETSNKEILSRYIKFNFILFGQCGDEYSEYGPVSPIISGINFTYNDAKEDLVFTNSIVPSARIKEFEISQSSSLEKSNNKKTYINFGYTSSNTYEWNDYEHSEISKRYIGKTILPIRDAIILSKTLETLKSKDGYVFEALYGNWDIDATVRVYDADNMEILASTYRSFPREGKIVFNEKQEVFDLYVKITDTLAKRIGMKITNFDTNAYLNLEGMSYFYAV